MGRRVAANLPSLVLHPTSPGTPRSNPSQPSCPNPRAFQSMKGLDPVQGATGKANVPTAEDCITLLLWEGRGFVQCVPRPPGPSHLLTHQINETTPSKSRGGAHDLNGGNRPTEMHGKGMRKAPVIIRRSEGLWDLAVQTGSSLGPREFTL